MFIPSSTHVNTQEYVEDLILDIANGSEFKKETLLQVSLDGLKQKLFLVVYMQPFNLIWQNNHGNLIHAYVTICLKIHTYIIGHYNPSVGITTQLLIPLMLCALILYMSVQHLQFKVDSERQIFEKFFMAILFSLRVFARNLLRLSCRRIIFIFSFELGPNV